MTECQPPNGHLIVEGYFWLKHKNGHMQPFQWFEGAWFDYAEPVEIWPDDMYNAGWTYHSPCEPPENT